MDTRFEIARIHFLKVQSNLAPHIDQFYCHPDAVGRGVASALYNQLEAVARARGTTMIFTEASETAKPFFTHRGFTLVKRRDFTHRGVKIHNYHVEKPLL